MHDVNAVREAHDTIPVPPLRRRTARELIRRLRTAVAGSSTLVMSRAELAAIADVLDAVEAWRDLPERWADMTAGPAATTALIDLEDCADDLAGGRSESVAW